MHNQTVPTHLPSPNALVQNVNSKMSAIYGGHLMLTTFSNVSSFAIAWATKTITKGLTNSCITHQHKYCKRSTIQLQDAKILNI